MAALEKLREIVAEFPGDCELQLLLCLADGARQYATSSLRVDWNVQLRQRIDELLGPGNVKRSTRHPRPGRARRARNGKFEPPPGRDWRIGWFSRHFAQRWPLPPPCRRYTISVCALQ